MTSTVTILEATTSPDIEAARALFLEYGHSLNFDLCFQSFDKELASLPGKYAPPRGCILLARVGSEIAGCVALRLLDEQTCEMKRLYVRPEFRGKQIGDDLVHRLIEKAKSLGYSRMRLDTVPAMQSAQRLYRSLGFIDIPAYCENPIPGAVYMELDLTV